METWLHYLAFGIVQGLTEFLPISSNAHVYLFATLLGWPEPGPAVTAVIQIGTEVAVLVYFWNELVALLRGLVGSIFSARVRETAEAHVAWGVVLGSIPIVVAGYSLRHVIENDVRNVPLIAVMLISFGFVLLLADLVQARRTHSAEFTPAKGLLMGFGQTLALIPGVSRSGATIAFGLFAGLERRVATRYAFLLAIPAVFGAGLLEAVSGDIEWGPTLLATLTAFFVGLAVIAGLLRFLNQHSFQAFAWYRIGLGLFLLSGVAAGWFN